jgi:hypothetical protein
LVAPKGHQTKPLVIDHYSEHLSKNCKEVGTRFRHAVWGHFSTISPQLFRAQPQAGLLLPLAR